MKRPIDALPGWWRDERAAVGSTNDEAMDWFRNGDSGQLWVTGTEQKTGKGRRNRAWHSPPGNLYASLLLVDPAPMQSMSMMPLLAVLALNDAVASLAPLLQDRLLIKWPNDLLLDGGKLAGILLEGSNRTSGEQGVVVGFGVNCEHAPQEALYPTATLAGSGAAIASEALFTALATAVAKRLVQWQQGQAPAAIRRDWLSRATGLNRTITVRFADHEKTGIFRDIASDGQLVLERPDGSTELVSAADVFLHSPNNEVPVTI
ncbi:MAG: biotin--[acetyl-CoA-carboxylase] ligase [Ahrensia sp.]|nr:biotin--[acetyl-CoA-carboxylase] ligase [Ahrensia sp.]